MTAVPREEQTAGRATTGQCACTPEEVGTSSYEHADDDDSCQNASDKSDGTASRSGVSLTLTLASYALVPAESTDRLACPGKAMPWNETHQDRHARTTCIDCGKPSMRNRCPAHLAEWTRHRAETLLARAALHKASGASKSDEQQRPHTK